MSNFQLSPDRRSAKADNMSIILNPECNKYTVTLRHNAELIVSFEFERVDRGFKIGGGKTYFGKDKSAGFVEHKFWPKGNVKGNIVVDSRAYDISGVGLFVHAIQGMRPHLIASRWNFINFQSDVAALSMCEFETTPQYGSKKVNQGSLVLNNKLVGVFKDNKAIFLKKEFDRHTGYDIPSEIRYTWEGKILETNEDFSAFIDIKLDVLMDRIDVLNEVPYFLKKIVQGKKKVKKRFLKFQFKYNK